MQPAGINAVDYSIAPPNSSTSSPHLKPSISRSLTCAYGFKLLLQSNVECLSSVPYLNKNGGQAETSEPPGPGEASQTRIEFYPNGFAKLVRRGVGNPDPPDNERGKITELSFKSRVRMLVTVGASGVRWRSMFVASYGKTFPDSGKLVKKNLNSLLMRFRRLRTFTTYFWWLEFQKRGAPHIHILLNFEPNDDDRYKVAKTWKKTVSGNPGVSESELEQVFSVHSHPNQWQAEEKPGGLIRDVALYATKPQQKRVPLLFQDVGRWWGASRDVKPVKVGEMPITDGDQARLLLESLEHRCADWDVLPTWLFGIDYSEPG